MSSEITFSSNGNNSLMVDGETYKVKDIADAKVVLLKLLLKFRSELIEVLGDLIPSILWENVKPIEATGIIIESTLRKNALLRDKILANAPDYEALKGIGLNFDDVVEITAALILNMAETPGVYNFSPIIKKRRFQ